MKFGWIGLLSFLFLVGCVGQPIQVSGVNVISERDYFKAIEPYSKRLELYQGITNALHVRATLLNSKVLQAQLSQKARIYQWDATTFQTESQKVQADAEKTTHIFVSFYTPERRHNDLHKSESLWKIFMDAEGRRWEGKATRIKLLPHEVMAVYPDHTRFGTPYLITFPVSIGLIEKSPIKLTITGPITTAVLEFQP